MAIKKQEFYEGAALHLLARTGHVNCIRYEVPFFRINANALILLKYCTKSRSPWGFTFGIEEQRLVEAHTRGDQTTIGLICGSDGVAAITFDAYLTIAAPRASAAHIACYRPHGKHYEVIGPDGVLDSKIAPSQWLRALEGRK